ncbi:MAG: molybdate ABC transporter substrate-binding protein [Bifidobacterium adolescentis]
MFASANAAQMDAAIKTGRVVSGTAQTFARNRLVVITPKVSPNAISQLKDLAKPGLKVVLADKAVPVGGYALDFLRKASAAPDFGATYSQTMLANVVSYEQDVKAVLSKVALGEADAGIVYTTDVLGDSASKVNRVDIPDALNTIATYPIAVINDSKNAELGKKFVTFVLSSQGQQILAKYGFN